MKKWFALVIAFLFYAVHSVAQFPKVSIPGSEVRTITSSIVNGQEYELHIMLPGGYNSSNKKYPVIYLMDSQWDFPLVKSIYGQQYYDGFIPEALIVGVTWGGVNANADSLRARDYTPGNEASLKQSGGADNFLSFLKYELFPFIESNYKADKENRVLMGCSFGGLITLYAMLTQPEMFTGYIAASPAVQWNREIIYQYEKAFAAKKLSKSIRLYMTIGDVEKSRMSFEKFASHLDNRHYANLHIQSKVLENTGHSGTKSETYSRGLQYIFERPKLKLNHDVLNKYAGTYQFFNGNKVNLKNEANQLVLYVNATNKYPLFAASETEFYSTSEYLKLHFKNDNNNPGFVLERFNNNQFLIKVNE